MKGNWKKIAVGGVSIGLAVSLLATSLTSHKPVQAVDVFSDAKALVKPNSTSFDIVELISERSSFPTIQVADGAFVGISNDNVIIGNEELAYLVGGEEPYSQFWGELCELSWTVDSMEQVDIINPAKNSLRSGLEKAGLLDLNDYTSHPLKMEIEDVSIPDYTKYLSDGSFLEISTYPEDENNTDIIGYYVRSDSGCYKWVATDNGMKMKYVGNHMVTATSFHLNFLSGWNSNYIEDEESEEYFDDEYEYEDEFWDEYEYENEYDNDEEYFYDPQNQVYGEEYDYTYVEEGAVSEERTVEYFYPDEEYSQYTYEVEIPTYQAEFTQEINPLNEGDGGTEGEPNGTEGESGGTEGEPGGTVDDSAVGNPEYMYNFYSVEELKQLETEYGLEENGDSLDKIPVYGNDVGDLRTFRYITLSNNEWLKTQIFGIEEGEEGTDSKFADYKVHVYSVVSETGVTDNVSGNLNLKATDCDDLSNIISTTDWTFSSTVKLFYIAQLPSSDISEDLRNNILSRVASSTNTMACIVNDANIHSILGDTINSTYPILQNLVTYLYQSDLAGYLYYTPDQSQESIMYTVQDKTPVLEEGDRVNILDVVDENGDVIDDVAHFVHKKVYAIDSSFVNSGVSLYDVILQGVDEGFDEVAYRIEQENFKREQDSQLAGKPFEIIPDVTRALAIQYILTYTDSDMDFSKAIIRVLELQPCYDFTYAPMEYLHPRLTVSNRGKDARVTAFMRDILNMKEEDIEHTPAYHREKGKSDEQIQLLPDIKWFEVEIVGMTTSEFCGKIEDINVEYDMIYWGSNIGTFNQCESFNYKTKHTVYNDYSMIGNVYTHVGDLGVNADYRSHLSSLLWADDDTHVTQSIDKSVMGWRTSGDADVSTIYRFSGNDILENQVGKLISFLKAGYPIVVADNFFRNSIQSSKDYENAVISSSDIVIDNKLTVISKSRRKQTMSESDATVEKDIKGILDTSTYIYQFINDVVTEKRKKDENNYPNFMTVSQIKNERTMFNVALNRPKIQIYMISQPIEYTYSTEVASKKDGFGNPVNFDVIDSANYLSPNNAGRYYLEYEFYISDASSMASLGTTYSAKLYVDANMDGKYTADEEMALPEVVNVDMGVVIPADELQNGTHYQIRRELPKEYIGAVPWKLEIFDNNNINVRGSYTGLSAVKEEKRDLYICQFVQQYKSNPEEYQYLGDNHNNNFNDRSDMWTELLEAVPDFNIHIISVDVEDYFHTATEENGNIKGYKDGVNGGYTNWHDWLDPEKNPNGDKPRYNSAGCYTDEGLKNKYRYTETDRYGNEIERVFDPTLKSYDMLLFGYREIFMQTEASNVWGDYINMGRVMEFIESGKSVLFTHDTTNVNNQKANNYTFSMAIRDVGGMDRYGITVGKSAYNGVTNSDIFSINKIRQGKTIIADSKDKLVSELFSGKMSEYKRDIAFKPGTNQTQMTPETIAVTPAAWDLEQRQDTNVARDVFFGAYDYAALNVDLKSFGTWGWPSGYNQHTVHPKVGKLNAGAITEYPYKLDDTIEISATHGQYYQLDLETDKGNDGEGDIVVWYTITNYYDDAKPDGYNISQNDARNNYYIFTKDNITYSGSGHRRIDKPDEIKLFINTMVAAYRVGTKAPDINLIGNPSTLAIKTSDSIPYDQDVSDTNVTYPVYFQIKDNNLLANEKKYVFYKAYLVDSEGQSVEVIVDPNQTEKTIKAKDVTYYLNNSSGYVLHKGNNVGVTDLPVNNVRDKDIVKHNKNNYMQNKYTQYGTMIDNEEVYRIDLPISLFQSRDVIELYIEGRSIVTKKDNDVDFDRMEVSVSEPIYTKYTLSKMELFDMD